MKMKDNYVYIIIVGHNLSESSVNQLNILILQSMYYNHPTNPTKLLKLMNL